MIKPLISSIAGVLMVVLSSYQGTALADPAKAGTGTAAILDKAKSADKDHLLPASPPEEEVTDRDDIPSCYKFAKLDKYADSTGSRELVIIIDKTTALTDELHKSARDAAERFIKRRDEVLIYEFSAYTTKDHLRLTFRGRLEDQIQARVRNSIGQDDLRVFDHCLLDQAKFFRDAFRQRFDASIGQPTTNFDKSEILYSLKTIAAHLHKRKVDHRVILVISDMLENSAFSTFYQNNQVRKIDPKAEIKRVKDKGLLADFDGAHVYIHGAGLIDPSAHLDYRSGVTITALQGFWTDYFTESNAILEDFGAPDLNEDLK